MRPSLLAVTSKPLRGAKSWSADSTMLGLPGETLITAWSKPRDLGERSTDFFIAAGSEWDTSNPAPVATEARRKSRRVASRFMVISPGVPFYSRKHGAAALPQRPDEWIMGQFPNKCIRNIGRK